MRFDTTYLHSRLARRIFWLFVVCALVPISALAIVSLLAVSSELQRESRRRLNQSSHDEGMAIYERLVLLDANLRLIAEGSHRPPSDSIAAPETALSQPSLVTVLEARYRGLAVVSFRRKLNPGLWEAAASRRFLSCRMGSPRFR